MKKINPETTIHIKNLHIHMDERMNTSYTVPSEEHTCHGHCDCDGSCGCHEDDDMTCICLNDLVAAISDKTELDAETIRKVLKAEDEIMDELGGGICVEDTEEAQDDESLDEPDENTKDDAPSDEIAEAFAELMAHLLAPLAAATVFGSILDDIKAEQSGKEEKKED